MVALSTAGQRWIDYEDVNAERSTDESMRVLKSGGLDQQPLQTRVRADIVR